MDPPDLPDPGLLAVDNGHPFVTGEGDFQLFLAGVEQNGNRLPWVLVRMAGEEVADSFGREVQKVQVLLDLRGGNHPESRVGPAQGDEALVLAEYILISGFW